jgi:hypothetical protein
VNPSIVFGFTGAAVGFASGIYLSTKGAGAGAFYHPTWIYSTVGAFTACSLTWQLLVERGKRYGIGNGAFVGLFAVGMSHFATWLLVQWFGWLCGNLLGLCRETGSDPLTGVMASAGLAIFSLVTMGWTLVVGAVLGGAYAKFRAARVEEDD